MWATLALAAALQAAPAQPVAFAFKNSRVSYSVLGQTRKDAKFLGGDLVILNYDLLNLKATEDAIVRYSLGLEVTNKAGKSIYKLEPQEFKAELTLGGNSRPGLSIYELPLDMAAGDYVFTVSGTDLESKATDKLMYPFEVLAPQLGFIQSGVHIPIGPDKLIPSPQTIPVGQTVMVGTAVVGFELGPKTENDLRKRQPHIIIETHIVDEATGKATLAKPKIGGVTMVTDDYKKAVPFTTLLEMNRPGRFKIEMKVTDKHAGKTAEFTLDVTVYEIK